MQWLCGFANAHEGISKMQKGCQRHGVPAPKFNYHQQGLWIEFQNHEPKTRGKLRDTVNKNDTVKSSSRTQWQMAAGDTVNDTVNDTVDDTVDDTVERAKRVAKKRVSKKRARKHALSKLEHQVLQQLRIAPTLTITQLVKKLKKSDSTLKRSIKKLQSAKKLERIGSDKKGHWKVL